MNASETHLLLCGTFDEPLLVQDARTLIDIIAGVPSDHWAVMMSPDGKGLAIAALEDGTMAAIHLQSLTRAKKKMRLNAIAIIDQDAIKEPVLYLSIMQLGIFIDRDPFDAHEIARIMKSFIPIDHDDLDAAGFPFHPRRGATAFHRVSDALAATLHAALPAELRNEDPRPFVTYRQKDHHRWIGNGKTASGEREEYDFGKNETATRNLPSIYILEQTRSKDENTNSRMSVSLPHVHIHTSETNTIDTMLAVSALARLKSRYDQNASE